MCGGDKECVKSDDEVWSFNGWFTVCINVEESVMFFQRLETLLNVCVCIRESLPVCSEVNDGPNRSTIIFIEQRFDSPAAFAPVFFFYSALPTWNDGEENCDGCGSSCNREDAVAFQSRFWNYNTHMLPIKKPWMYLSIKRLTDSASGDACLWF